MASGSTKSSWTWITPVVPETEPTVCRLYSIPESLVGNWDGAIGLLCSPHLWTVGDEPEAAAVDDVTAAYAAIIDKAWSRGCRMVGEIIELATDTIPEWALVCDGSTYADDEYPELGAVISAGLRIDAGHFRVPDRYNRFGMYGPPTGVQGGENTHVLTAGEMPTHTHVDTGHQHTEVSPLGEFLALGPGEEPVVLASTPTLTGSASAAIQDAGGGGGHNNLPQYEGTVFVIVAVSQ